MVELRKLAVDYPRGSGRSADRVRVPAVAGADAVFNSGGISAIVGPSGCGKTSLVHAVAGLLVPSSGEALIDDRKVAGVRAKTAVIFQDYGLLPWRTVEGNAELPLALAGLGRAERRSRVGPLLEELGLAAFRDFYPAKLSGGMKQRVAIARALAAEPDLLLMDEPFSSLDALTREAAQEFLLEVRRSRPLTILVVTHSIEEAAYLAETVFVMSGRNPGTIRERFDVPENAAAARFAPGSRRDDFRATPRYLKLCAAIRSSLRGAGPTEDGATS
ncbi:MAG: ABC transporter ATP-binding protein [Spirochaetae bacterium HGW-Spirochaetae-7]|jgi:NitT/TauT family transport system ATP-binding protein|nr:MAG: ABC transporter ATP-binding protein [Spirochaetae bacterium HGW-Spirochaetae-7]